MSLQRIGIFGATGQVGLKATEYALKEGLTVKVLVRDVSKLPEDLQQKVEVVVGDVTNFDDVKKVVEGQDGIIVTLGTRNNLSATTVMSEGLKNIIKAMKEYEVQKISVCLSAFLFYEPEKVPAIFHNLNEEHKRMFDLLKGTPHQWIAVFPPHFTDDEPREYVVKPYASPGRTISKTDLGSFMVKCLSNQLYYQKALGIANC